jgi:Ser/Thr protein kinase RdoA (MazF antagonist)
MFQMVLQAYGFDQRSLIVESFGSGLINNTWKVSDRGNEFILQRINTTVFKDPSAIAHNIGLIAAYLGERFPGYTFMAPVTTKGGDQMVFIKGEGYFRLFPFAKDSHSKDVVETPQQAYEAAVQFGRFSKLLSGLDTAQLQTTIPSFHDLELRYEQFLEALKTGNAVRREQANEQVDTLRAHSGIVEDYRNIVNNPAFKLRVTHHDTKISNVLFNSRGEGLCVIDLDTVMPGYFISDVGDMMRTYLCPVSEEECDFSKILIRDSYYEAIVEGYYSEMKDHLTPTEKQYFFYAGKFMIYMQALRYLTDYINDDRYYGARYPAHNLVRTINQITLLEALMQKQHRLQKLL